MWSSGSAGAVFLLAFLSLAHTDDRFTCCMGGWKVMRGVTLCPAPCCPGYEIRTLHMPLLKSPIICHKLTQEELKKKKEARMAATTTTAAAASTPSHQDLLDDEPRRMIRASSEFQDFLYRHRHFLLRLMKQGYSRKELLTSMEHFLVTVLPSWLEEAEV
ncbi:uncharacterized protein [Procambarus clarkii]|uniref:uncharacterized protein isoform X2 n=1 Tax=Procambarus clarkii TaxID=6728 RepID=UPI001E67678A|nr:uncharacterized protein LOC123764162 isoform X1 [Procambarus clarkii]